MEKHETKVEPNTAISERYTWKVTCSCHWEALASSQEAAERYATSHKNNRVAMALSGGVPWGPRP